MEILLIGNGFDLEHSLPTSYNDFLEFCKRARRIYTYDESKPLHYFIQNNFYNWKTNSYFYDILVDAFKNRKIVYTPQLVLFEVMKVTTPNKLLNELFSLIDDNAWYEYFLTCSSNIGENWIDFEAEISRVIRVLDEARSMAITEISIMTIQSSRGKVLADILEVSKRWKRNVSLSDAFKNASVIDSFVSFLYGELEKLIRALEIYIAEFVHGIAITKKSADIERLNPDHILSFNYSDTYERVYGIGKKIEYAYIHGKADINKTVDNSNVVLGIDEYLDDERKDKELEFLTFKKFYQRIYKSTGNSYLNWVDEIKDDLAASLKSGYIVRPSEHTLYIFGHSLDVTDKDILKLFICNDNVQTKIFYYRKNEDDKTVLGKLIRNLIQIMGQDELIRRTGGAHKTIEFIPQTLS